MELENLRTREIVPLQLPNGALPNWSPDGKYISCVVWKSIRQPHELTVVDVASRAMILDPEVEASGTEMKWSPDSRTLAAAGVLYGRPRTALYTVSVPEGRIQVLDTLEVLAGYEFSWSPDGRWIVYSKATELDEHGEDPVAADLWVAEFATGTKWPLLVTPGYVERDPLWITNLSLQMNRVSSDSTGIGVEQTLVIELSKEGPPQPPR